MTPEAQQARAVRLRELHDPARPLVLPNIWDPLGARILASHGFGAVATASSAIANSLGFPDGERLSRDAAFAAIRRIAAAVEVPVTADIEAGYAESIEELAESVAAVLETGVAGINLEDSVVEGVQRRSIDEQCERLATVRSVAERSGVDLVVNARIDAFLDTGVVPEIALQDVLDRAEPYVEAGADVIYPIGPCDAETVIRLRSGIDAPLNILIGPHAPPVAVFREIGIERVSLGPFLHRAAVGRVLQIAEELGSRGSYEAFGDDIPTAPDLAPYLREEAES